MKSLSDEVTEFSDILDPKHFDIFIEAVKSLGSYDKDTKLMQHPATADALGMLTKDLCKVWIMECNKLINDKATKDAERFLLTYENLFNKMVSNIISESQSEMKRLKKVKLPSIEDIQKLREHLNSVRREAYLSLNDKFSISAYKALLESTLVTIQLFNRRRAGEIERLKIYHFNARETIDEKTSPDEFKLLDNQGKRFVAMYSRILIRGKRNRTVPILLNIKMIKCIEMLLKNRKAAKVSSSNPYVFGIYSADKKEHKYASACIALRSFSTECGASLPETLRGTLLRKHIATNCISMNLSDDEIDGLANFMGHAEKIHRTYYRISLAQRDIINVASLLEKAQGIFDENNPSVIYNDSDKKSDTEKLVNVAKSRRADDDSFNDDCMQPPCKRKRVIPQKKTPPSISQSRTAWDVSAQQAIFTRYPNFIKENKIPSGTEIQQLIDTTPVSSLKNRNVAQVRSWMHLKKKQRKKDAPITSTIYEEGRNTVPTFIYSLFGKYIEANKLPTIEALSLAYTKSPSIEKYSIQEIRELISKAIKLKKKKNN